MLTQRDSQITDIGASGTGLQQSARLFEKRKGVGAGQIVACIQPQLGRAGDDSIVGKICP